MFIPCFIYYVIFVFFSDTVTLTPIFKQEMILEMRIKPPFKIVNTDDILVENELIQVKDASSFDVTVIFDTSFKTDGYSWSADGALMFSFRNHPSKVGYTFY